MLKLGYLEIYYEIVFFRNDCLNKIGIMVVLMYILMKE